MDKPVAIKLGYLTRREAPNGTHYLQGDIGNLRVTIVAEPGMEPSSAGDLVYSVHARQVPVALKKQASRRTPLPKRAPFDLQPSPAITEAARPSAPANPSESINRRPVTKSEREAAMLDDVRFRLGALPAGGDPVPSLGVQDDDDILSRPLVMGE